MEKTKDKYLIVGIDESNHINEYTNQAEVVTAVFSSEINDGAYKAYCKKRDEEKVRLLNEWMNDKKEKRDYRFATLTNMTIRRFKYNICIKLI